MSESLILRISVGPEALRMLNRGEMVKWEGVAHPLLTVELAPIAQVAAPVTAPVPSLEESRT